MPTTKIDGRMLSGFCPDGKCQTKLFFPSYDSSIECTNCGQRHDKSTLTDIQEITDHNVALHNIIRNVLLGSSAPKRGTEMIKVLGLSNYHCKLLSPFLTRYGMDKAGKARPLIDLNRGDTFDCSVLGHRCFLIDPEHVEVVGYGRDVSGSGKYLEDTLKMIAYYGNNEERLLPIHADGDGHCLVHAVSRALVGRELFWHPLRTSLKRHFEINLEKYKEQLKDFIDKSEWDVIIEECDSDFRPCEGEIHGLRNIHIFGLANVLHRPIILLDSLEGMQSPGDYSATFLPGLLEPSDCRGKPGELNKPLCIAWSSSGRNHYIPLVGIKNRPLPRLPRALVPKVWCMAQDQLNRYVQFDLDGFLTVGGNNVLKDDYILKLAAAMEEIFVEKYGVCPELVADVHHYIFKRTGFVGAQMTNVLEATQKAVREKRLFRCLTCDAILEQKLLPEWFKPSGLLYVLAEQRHGPLRSDKLYSFPQQGITCSYDVENHELVPDGKNTMIEKCTWCHGSIVRLVEGNGNIVYKNGDRTKTPARSNHCRCGQKHFWEGREYDNMPEMIPVAIEWNGKTIKEKIAWFQNESDPSLNSNAFKIASCLVEQHFPAEFGTRRVEDKIVEQILEATKKPEELQKAAPETSCEPSVVETSPNKIILSGRKIVHKEELNKSEAEKTVLQRIHENAGQRQRRKSAERPSSTTNRIKTKMASPAKDLNVTAEPRNSSPAHKPQNVVRVVTSDGRQLQVTLDPQLTYQSFKQTLQLELNLPAEQQKIMYGFPPRELAEPLDGQQRTPLPFNPGDKILVEILQGKTEEKDNVARSKEKTSDTVGELLRHLENGNDDEDEVLASLLVLKTLAGQSLWSHVQNMPELFNHGGIFYSQMRRTMAENKHCQLSILPDKAFWYNATQDRFELCVKSRGHFPIEPGVEEKASQSPDDGSSCGKDVATRGPGQQFLAGSSGLFVPESQRVLTGHVPFQGQGFSLCSGGQVKDGKQETEDKMETDAGVESYNTDGKKGRRVLTPSSCLAAPLVRKGPGYSVLDTSHGAGISSSGLRYSVPHSAEDNNQGSNTDTDEDMGDGNL